MTGQTKQGTRMRALLLSLALIPITFSCSQSLENNPVFQDEVARMVNLGDDLKATKRQVTNIEVSMQQLSESVRKVAGQAGGAQLAGQIQPLQRKVDDIDAVLSSLRASLEKIDERLVKMEQTQGTLVAQVKSQEKKIAEAGSSRRVVAEVAAAPAKPSAGGASAGANPAASASAAPGFYYEVKQGDTLSSISKAHDMTLAQLRTANKLPQDRDKVIAGTQLYIPRSY